MQPLYQRRSTRGINRAQGQQSHRLTSQAISTRSATSALMAGKPGHLVLHLPAWQRRPPHPHPWQAGESSAQTAPAAAGH